MRLVLLLAFGLGVALQLLLPAWMGEDELWHVEYATLIARGASPLAAASHDRAWFEAQLEYQPLSLVLIQRRFDRVPPARLASLQTEILDAARANGFSRQVDWASDLTGADSFDHVAPGFSAAHQPPFYYLVVGWTARLLGAHSPTSVLRVGRALALLAFVLAVFATGRTALRLGLTEEAASVSALVLVLWPQYARGAAVVNNDVFARLFAALALWAAIAALAARLRRAPDSDLSVRLTATALFALFAGLALLSKPTAVAVPLGAGLVLVLAGRSWRWRAGLLLGVLGVLAFLFRTWDASPVTPPSFASLGARVSAAGSGGFWRALVGTATGSFAWDSRSLPSALILTAAAALLALAGVGFADLWRQERASWVTWVLCLPLVLQLGSVVLRGVPVGRYLFPALPALALLVGHAWMHSPRRTRPLFLVLLAFSSIYLSAGLFLHHHLLQELP